MANATKSAPKPTTPPVTPETETVEKTEEVIETQASIDLSVFDNNPLIRGMVDDYLRRRLEIVKFNEEVLAAEHQASANVWTQTKLVKEAKSLAQPEDANTPVDPEVKRLYTAYEKALDAVNKARNDASKFMADKLKVEMVFERPKPDENEVKRIQETIRLPAVEVAKNLSGIADFAGAEAKEAIDRVLQEHPLPQVGRKGSWDPTQESSSKPKYRVDTTAVKDGKTLFTGDDGKGFTKASLTAKKFHAKDMSPTPDDFRKAWEAGGKKNTEFVHDGVTYQLAAR